MIEPGAFDGDSSLEYMFVRLTTFHTGVAKAVHRGQVFNDLLHDDVRNANTV